MNLQLKDIQMYKENKTELFIRLLVEELEADSMIKNFGLYGRSQVHATRLERLFNSDLKPAVDSIEPPDCFQMMSAAQERRIG
jgi:hypothetical protein